MKWSQKILLAGYVLALAGMLTLPATAQQVTIALGSEPTTLDPQLREDGGERAVNDNIYETLMARDPNGNLVPGLAAGTPGLVDPQTWEIKLRPGIKFHNGESLNAERQTDHRSEI
jgi:peptide/nickel transport system substrate-binding protein